MLKVLWLYTHLGVIWLGYHMVTEISRAYVVLERV